MKVQKTFIFISEQQPGLAKQSQHSLLAANATASAHQLYIRTLMSKANYKSSELVMTSRWANVQMMADAV